MMRNSVGLVEQQKSETKKKISQGCGGTLSETEDGGIREQQAFEFSKICGEKMN